MYFYVFKRLVYTGLDFQSDTRICKLGAGQKVQAHMQNGYQLKCAFFALPIQAN